MFKRFQKDFKRYWPYALYSAKAMLKSEVANSYLNWLWWIIDPFSFMLIYTFIFGYVFKSREQYFPLFIFIGITIWDFFNRNMTQSVRLVKANKATVSKVYLPKYMLLISKILVNGFKMLVSVGIIVAMLIFYRVPIRSTVIYLIPILMALVLISFGIGCYLMHYGVYVEDLSNVIGIALKLLFYITGIFFNIQKKIPEPYCSVILKANPIAFLLDATRRCLLYGKLPHRKFLLLWLLVGLVISALGVRKIYKNENSYVKVI